MQHTKPAKLPGSFFRELRLFFPQKANSLFETVEIGLLLSEIIFIEGDLL